MYNIVLEYLKEGIIVSIKTIKKELKELGYRYKRLKKFTAKAADTLLVKKAKDDIKRFEEEEKKEICLFVTMMKVVFL